MAAQKVTAACFLNENGATVALSPPLGSAPFESFRGLLRVVFEHVRDHRCGDVNKFAGLMGEYNVLIFGPSASGFSARRAARGPAGDYEYLPDVVSADEALTWIGDDVHFMPFVIDFESGSERAQAHHLETLDAPFFAALRALQAPAAASSSAAYAAATAMAPPAG